MAIFNSLLYLYQRVVIAQIISVWYVCQTNYTSTEMQAVGFTFHHLSSVNTSGSLWYIIKHGFVNPHL